MKPPSEVFRGLIAQDQKEDVISRAQILADAWGLDSPRLTRLFELLGKTARFAKENRHDVAAVHQLAALTELRSLEEWFARDRRPL